MDESKIPKITPENIHGKENDLEHGVLMDSIEDAESFFVVAKERLLNVNDWHTYAGSMSSQFSLTDKHGNVLHRQAHKGDLIRIHLPGTGDEKKEDYDWVRIEQMQYDDYPDTGSETIAFTVRPVPAPDSHKSEQEPAHFFNAQATSTFAVQRKAREVFATYHGRNEAPNTESGNLLDKARNAVIAIGAMLGFSEVQWQKLVTGILEYKSDKE